jgi:glycosyltransferase involved in cell wall biosynthesis
MRIVIISDAWTPQVNGVVRTLKQTERELKALGHQVRFIVPQGRRGFALPFYPEIRLAFASARGIGREIEAFLPDAVHIATEGPLGLAARRWCLSRKVRFTTAFHTRHAEFIHAMLPLPGIQSAVWALLKWFHGPSHAVMAPTPSMVEVLKAQGFARVKLWSRGVDHDLFKPQRKNPLKHLPRPRLILSGRVAAEKGVEEFLALDVPGSKIVIGDGPLRKKLQEKYPQAHFTGFLHNGEYASHMAAADCFVFTGRHDTFGLVTLEALSCGVPVAAYPVPGPRDIIEDGVSGALDDDLEKAVKRALKITPKAARARALQFSWKNAARQFADYLAPVSPSS